MNINRNMLFLYTIFILCSLQFSFTIAGSSIIFPQNLTNCPMYTESCPIQMLISKNVPINDLNFTYNGLVYFSFVKYQACTNVSNDCKFENLNESLYDPGLIIIQSIIVGKGTVQVQYGQSSVEHSVIITQPQRIIDKIWRAYLSIFQIMISTIMGVLIDIEALKKIVKMPVPVLIGFFAQYGCMPLVSCSSFLFLKLTLISLYLLFL
jgi:hypothetical protein